MYVSDEHFGDTVYELTGTGGGFNQIYIYVEFEKCAKLSKWSDFYVFSWSSILSKHNFFFVVFSSNKTLIFLKGDTLTTRFRFDPFYSTVTFKIYHLKWVPCFIKTDIFPNAFYPKFFLFVTYDLPLKISKCVCNFWYILIFSISSSIDYKVGPNDNISDSLLTGKELDCDKYLFYFPLIDDVSVSLPKEKFYDRSNNVSFN